MTQGVTQKLSYYELTCTTVVIPTFPPFACKLTRDAFQRKRAKERLEAVAHGTDIGSTKAHGCTSDEVMAWSPAAMLQQDTPKHDIRNEDGSWMCQSCKQPTCLMTQITEEIEKNDLALYDELLFERDPNQANRQRRYSAYQLASFLIEGRLGKGVRKELHDCVRTGILMMFPPFDGKVTGFKSGKSDKHEV